MRRTAPTSYQHDFSRKSVAMQVQLVVEDGGHDGAPQGARVATGCTRK